MSENRKLNPTWDSPANDTSNEHLRVAIGEQVDLNSHQIAEALNDATRTEKGRGFFSESARWAKDNPKTSITIAFLGLFIIPKRLSFFTKAAIFSGLINLLYRSAQKK